MPGSGGLFSNDAFLRLWAAATLTNFGSMVTRIALPFLAITVLDASPAELAALTAAGLLPGITAATPAVVATTAVGRAAVG